MVAPLSLVQHQEVSYSGVTRGIPPNCGEKAYTLHERRNWQSNKLLLAGFADCLELQSRTILWSAKRSMLLRRSGHPFAANAVSPQICTAFSITNLAILETACAH